MNVVQQELDRISAELRENQKGEKYNELYAAQQALVWALEPSAFRSPYMSVMGIQAGLEDCSAPHHQPVS